MNAAIAEIIKRKTVLVIAHRLQTIVNADKICVMKDGNIIAADTHEKLLQGCAEYQKLWNSSEARANWTIGNEVRALVASVILQAVFQYLADRLQSGAGYLIFADMRMKLGEHLRRLPMGYFTEGNIGKISSVLSTDMVFIEENCMMVLADMMSYLFSQAIMIVFMFVFDWRLGIASLVITGCMVILGRHMMKSDLVHSDEKQEAAKK